MHTHTHTIRFFTRFAQIPCDYLRLASQDTIEIMSGRIAKNIVSKNGVVLERRLKDK